MRSNRFHSNHWFHSPSTIHSMSPSITLSFIVKSNIADRIGASEGSNHSSERLSNYKVPKGLAQGRQDVIVTQARLNFPKISLRCNGQLPSETSNPFLESIPGMIKGNFEGNIKEGVRDGEGRLEWSNGDYYVGSFKNGLRHGQGTLVEQNGLRKYEGYWCLSQKEGKGKEVFANGDEYIGDYSKDLFNGFGELKTKGGLYTGKFKDGYKNGVGTMQFKGNTRYEGNWVNGRFEGKGLYIWSDGRRYEGQWVNGDRTGMGVLTFVNGEKYGMFTQLICYAQPYLLLI